MRFCKVLKRLERETGFEPATLALARHLNPPPLPTSHNNPNKKPRVYLYPLEFTLGVFDGSSRREDKHSAGVHPSVEAVLAAQINDSPATRSIPEGPVKSHSSFAEFCYNPFRTSKNWRAGRMEIPSNWFRHRRAWSPVTRKAASPATAHSRIRLSATSSSTARDLEG